MRRSGEREGRKVEGEVAECYICYRRCIAVLFAHVMMVGCKLFMCVSPSIEWCAGRQTWVPARVCVCVLDVGGLADDVTNRAIRRSGRIGRAQASHVRLIGS